MGCPKRIAHGPCGAMWEGICEVDGAQPCAFVGLAVEDAAYRSGAYAVLKQSSASPAELRAVTCPTTLSASSPLSEDKCLTSRSSTSRITAGVSECLSQSTASQQPTSRPSTSQITAGVSECLSQSTASQPALSQSPAAPSTFAEKLNAGRFVVTGEVAPPHGVDCSDMLASIRMWKSVSDAVNITDNQGATLHLSSLAASRMALDEGVESIFQQTCRDRNRLALQSDLLAAHTLGLRNFLAVTGDNPAHDASVRRMFDLNSTQLLQMARGLNNGVNMEGKPIGEPTAFYLGAAAFLDVEPWEAQFARIAQKIDAGAQFFQTQAIMDIDKVAPRIKQVQELGAKVIPGVLLLKTPRVIAFINSRLEGLHVPATLARRIEAASDPLAEAIDIAVEQAQMIAEVADGIHVMPLGEDGAGIEIIRRAGIR